MRIFVLYDRDGSIVSAAKVSVLAPDLEHPYGVVAEGQAVLSVEATPELEVLDSLEIAESFVVEPETRQLTPASAGPALEPPGEHPPRRRGERRGNAG